MVKIIKPVFLGIIAAGGALTAELLFSFLIPGAGFSETAVYAGITLALVLSAAIEEIFKFTVIYKSFGRLNSARDILFSSLLLGLGFAAAEIMLSAPFEISAIPQLYFGLPGIIFVHALTAVIMGFFIGRMKIPRNAHIFLVIFLAAALHLAYNATVLYARLQK